MPRGWTEVDEGVRKITERDRVRIEQLMDEWDGLRREDEEDSWRRERIREGDQEHESPDFETQEELLQYEERERIRLERREERRASIEVALAKLGVRPMRPYEHWNEDEAYMEWQECGRHGEDPGW